MKIKTIILTLILGIGFSLQQCGLICGCGDLAGEFFDIQGISSSPIKDVGSGLTRAMVSNETIYFSKFEGIKILYMVNYHSSLDSYEPLFNFSLMNSALACSCNENGWRGSQNERYSSIEVTTLNDFDVNHPKNSLINDLIQIDDFSQVMSLDDFLLSDTSLIKSESLLLKLLEKPILNDTIRLSIRVNLSTNESYTSISSPIIIK